MTPADDNLERALSAWPPGGLDAELERLQIAYFPSIAHADIAGLLHDPALANTAIVSSFGAESAVLLHFVLGLRPHIPVIFLDTGKHFPETLAYRDSLAALLDFDLRVVTPDADALEADDPWGRLHVVDPNACCTLRKTFPLQDALSGFSNWISGRKRYQAASRATLPLLERDGERIKVNPFALWSADDVQAYFQTHNLPRHPLEAQGFPSIGCAPCTRAVADGEDPRAGRWPQMPDKTECGIHLGPDGHFVRTNARTRNGED